MSLVQLVDASSNFNQHPDAVGAEKKQVPYARSKGVKLMRTDLHARFHA